MKKALIIAALGALFVLPIHNSLKPVEAQQDPPRADCCYQIYSVGSNLGWASALLDHTTTRNGLVPADDVIFGALSRAGGHVESSYKTCSSINPAWPGWSSYQGFLQNQANAIRQRPDPVARTQVAASIRGTFSWAEALRHQVWGGQQIIHDTCAEKYFELGFLLGYAQQGLAIAQELQQSGSIDWQKAVGDALMPLQSALQVLNQYFALQGCTDLRGLNLPTRIQNVRQADPRTSLPAMHQEAMDIWQDVQRALTNRCDFTPGPGPILRPGLVGVWRQQTPQVPQPPTVRIELNQNNMYMGYLVDPGSMANEGFSKGERIWFFRRNPNQNLNWSYGARERRRPNISPYNEGAIFTLQGPDQLVISGQIDGALPTTTWIRISM